jgi:hypothetical protein
VLNRSTPVSENPAPETPLQVAERGGL